LKTGFKFKCYKNYYTESERSIITSS